MKLSKILKKESVILNDGKYAIPVLSNPAILTNKSANNSEELDKTDKTDKIEKIDKSDKMEKAEILEISDILDNDDSEYREYRDYSDYYEMDIQNQDNYENTDDVNIQFNQTNQTNQDVEKTAVLIDEEIIAQSHKTAELIINHALESAKIELDNVVSQGYKDGYEDGKEEALKIIEPSLLKINILADAMKKMQDKMFEESQNGMFNIISEISNKILHREINEKDEYLVELFADAVKNMKAEGFVTMTISGAQIDFAMRNIDLFRAEVANISDFKIVPDKNAEKGTMVVETANALADASYVVQQEKINAIISQMRDNLTIANSYKESAEDTVLKAYYFDNSDNAHNIVNNASEESKIQMEMDDNGENIDNISNIKDII